jgi:N-acetylglutamate synthase-like GNAT family acetyltransferase
MDTTRLAHATDANEIAELQMANWHIEHPAVARLLDPRDVQTQWEQAITNHGSGRVLVCERNGTLVGVAAVEFKGETGLLSLLEVAPSVRRELIGSRLLNAVADIASQTGCFHLRAWLTTRQNDGKLFLESTGWAATGLTRTVRTETGVTGGSELTDQQIELFTSL